MFTSLKRWSLAAVVLGAGLVAAGCQANGAAPAAAGNAGPATQAVACSKCHVTWVKQPVTAGGGKDWRVLGYTSRKSHECPDCRSAASNFFTNGKMEHTCKTCGDALEACEAH